MIYNKYRNVLTSVIKRAKANYYEGVFFKSKNNIKKTWSYIREIACKNSAKQPLRSLVVNNDVLISYTEISEAFNNFFELWPLILRTRCNQPMGRHLQLTLFPSVILCFCSLLLEKNVITI